MDLTERIKRRAISVGFDVVGVTNASPLDAECGAVLRAWLEAGYAGQMEYMKRNVEKRLEPGKLLEGARSVVVVGLNYKAEKIGRPEGGGKYWGRVASYAWYEDYHDFIRERLRELAGWLRGELKEDFRCRICVDSAPVAERALAVRAGVGFWGRNHMVIHPEIGCQLLLGELIVDFELVPDRPIEGGCSECRRCIESCPTGALREDGWFDARRCINYLTIEYRGDIGAEAGRWIGDRVFGCEQCLAVCPYQRSAPVRRDRQWRLYPERAWLDLEQLLKLDAGQFAARFCDSPIRRVGLEGLQRNARVCLENLRGDRGSG